MDEMKEREDETRVEDVEIEPLSDDALDSVSGGAEETESSGTCCSCSGCSHAN